MGTIGPNTYLPGGTASAPNGAMCMKHSDRFAVKILIGETDSFGSETIEMCQQCLDEYLVAEEERKEIQNTLGEGNANNCEQCGVNSPTVRPRRDPEEGRCGRVYYWCRKCADNVFTRFAE